MTEEITFTSDIRDLKVELVQHMGGDDAVVQAMLVSTKGEEALDAKATQGRINFLMKNRHGTPFEHNAMTFFVAAPVFVFREFHRHRIGFSYNEMSGRYRELPPKFYIPPPNRNLVQTGKPGEYKFELGTGEQYGKMAQGIRRACNVAYFEYQTMLTAGIAKEVARMCLPVNIFSEMFVTCNARSLMHFLSLRTSSDQALIKSTPMWEIEQVAQEMETHFASKFPMTFFAFLDNGRVAP